MISEPARPDKSLPTKRRPTALFSTLSYNGTGSWSGRLAGIAIALALSTPVVGIWYYGSNLVILMTQYSTRNVPRPSPPRNQRRMFPASKTPGVVSVQIMQDQKKHP